MKTDAFKERGWCDGVVEGDEEILLQLLDSIGYYAGELGDGD